MNVRKFKKKLGLERKEHTYLVNQYISPRYLLTVKVWKLRHVSQRYNESNNVNFLKTGKERKNDDFCYEIVQDIVNKIIIQLRNTVFRYC